MRKTILFIVLLIGLGFSVVNLTPQQAGEIAGKYKETTETVDLSPSGLTYSGAAPYYVMELKGALDTIIVMLPINAETKQVEYGDSVLDLLKTHYLANYFAPDDNSVRTFLDSTLTYASAKSDAFRSALQDLSVYEAQLTSQAPNETLQYLQPLKDSLTDTKDNKVTGLIKQIQDTQFIISAVDWRTTDVDAANRNLDAVFSKQEAFFDGVDNAADNAASLNTELAGDQYLLANYYNLVVGMQGVLSKLTYVPTSMRASLNSNRNAVNTFFSTLDTTGGQYLAKLRERLDKYIDPTEIEAIRQALNAYDANYTTILSNSGSMTSTCANNIEALRTAITEAKQYFYNQNYTQAKANFESIDSQISSLMSCIDQCPPQCSGGRVPNSDCKCVCPAGMTESNGQCVGGFSLNLPLIGGLILIISLLIVFKYKDKIFPGGGKVEEMPKDAWSNYKF